PVIQPVDRGVELVMTANGHEDVPVGSEIVIGNRADGEVRLPGAGDEVAMARRVGQVERPRRDLRIEVLEAGYDPADAIANTIVIGRQAGPVDPRGAAERLPRDPGDDGDLA